MKKEKKELGGFKLIAITPMKSCDPKFCKNLEIGKSYQFYAGYHIQTEKDFSKVISVKRTSNNEINLYELNNGINLSFSAIVGKNGTGKSTIFELLYYLIYAVSTKKSKGEIKILVSEQEDTIIKQKEAQNDYSWFENCLNIQLKKEKGEVLTDFDREVLEHDYKDPYLIALEMHRKYKIEIELGKVTDDKSYIKAVKSGFLDNVLSLFYVDVKEKEKWDEFFRQNFACSVIYESNSVIKEVAYYNSRFCYSEFDPLRKEKITDVNQFDLSTFFYSVSLNFSHHSLNSKTLGKWIDRLFHKNDAYITPLVINPMRNNGNFDINHELKLSRERLLANILYDLVRKKNSYLLGKYKVSKFIFSPKVLSGFPDFDFKNEFISDLKSSVLFQEILGIKKLDDKIEYWKFAIGYLERKVDRIENNYGHLIFDELDVFNRREKLKKFLLEDKSHITKKIRQVLNFLRITYKREHRDFWKIPDGTLQIEFSEEVMLRWLSLFEINLLEQTPSDLIEIGLPGFFKIDFLLEDKLGNKIEFSKLSSGEQQMILNTNSILYHLFNLESIHQRNNESEEKIIERVEYRDINIILDEVELYYHPEMQRRLVADLIENFQRLKTKQRSAISAINVCILTHSPFVLSDIPVSNILRLNDDSQNADESQTFGANIHDLLKSNFFLNNGFVGDFAKKVISDLIKYLKSENLNTPNENNWNKSKAKYVISLVGEPLLKMKLAEMFDSKFKEDYEIELLRARIKDIEENKK